MNGRNVLRVLLLLIISVLAVTSAEARDKAEPLLGAPNGLAQTPPMGWNSWNRFACHVNEALIRSAADAMVSSGMRDAGYSYIVIDDCWQGERDAKGFMAPDAKKFPSGMKVLADYVHAKGLKFGIYSDAGTKTCGGFPGSHGYETQDAQRYAEWGVDYLKYDWCNTDKQDAPSSYLTMSKALQASGRPIVFSLCEWGNTKPWLWAQNIGNLWRNTGDIADRWDGMDPNGYSMGLLKIVDMQAGLEAYAGPGHWNDPDMLEVGNGGMTDNEYRAHFSLWAMFAAPLIAGNDLAAMSPATRDILLNKEVIAVDQDSLGVAASRVWKDGDAEVWVRPLKGGGRAVVLLNRGLTPREIGVSWEQLRYPDHLVAKLRDLWLHKETGTATARTSAVVAGHAVVMLTISP
ncbi:MAG: glycoside hydrolase family 27 protein [Rhizomicrobium sp.]|nr:glycoside hydrolase family 27 protein [Rhizomicrobium sp.]